MIDKNKILKYFQEDEKDIVVKVLDKIEVAYRRNIPVFTKEFLTPKIWDYFVKTSLIDIDIKTVGIFDDAERRILAINSDNNYNYPLTVLKIINKSQFSKLEHRDYLGAILSLGIQRDKIGDIVVKDNLCYLVCLQEISDFIIYNLSSIGKSKISISIVNELKDLPIIEFEEFIINVSSLRLDGIVSKLANLSRSKSIDIINSAKVLIDYSPVRDKSIEIKENMRITIRGVGKFIIGSVIGQTRSGKKKVIIKKYC